MSKKKVKQTIKSASQCILVAILLLAPLTVPGIIHANQKIKVTSWQELKENERRYLELSVCTDYLEIIDSAVTNNLVSSLLKKGNTCLNSLSFIKKDDIAYLNLLEIEEAIDKKEVENTNEIREVIKENLLEIQGSLIWSTRSGFIVSIAIKSLALGLLFWFILASLYQNKWIVER